MKYIFCLLIIFCFSCAQSPYRAKNKLYKKGGKTTNGSYKNLSAY